MKLVHDSDDVFVAGEWAPFFELVDAASAHIGAEELHLRLAGGKLRLHRGEDRRGVGIDAVDLARRTRGDFALGRACGAARSDRWVVDATAGLGADALTLRARGYRVAMIEREPALWAMLKNHLGTAGPADVPLLLGDARDLLGCADTPWRGAPAVVYVDTMFPDSGKTALPGKKMQYLRQLLEGTTDDGADLLTVSLELATERVVVKRRSRDPVLREPSWQIRASSIRYDVYRPGVRNPLSARA